IRRSGDGFAEWVFAWMLTGRSTVRQGICVASRGSYSGFAIVRQVCYVPVVSLPFRHARKSGKFEPKSQVFTMSPFITNNGLGSTVGGGDGRWEVRCLRSEVRCRRSDV